MLDSNTNVSDLNLTVGKPFQVESSGQLVPVDIKPSIKDLTPFNVLGSCTFVMPSDFTGSGLNPFLSISKPKYVNLSIPN